MVNEGVEGQQRGDIGTVEKTVPIEVGMVKRSDVRIGLGAVSECAVSSTEDGGDVVIKDHVVVFNGCGGDLFGGDGGSGIAATVLRFCLERAMASLSV